MGKTRRATSLMPRKRTKKARCARLREHKIRERTVTINLVKEVLFEILNRVENVHLVSTDSEPPKLNLIESSNCSSENQPTCSKYLESSLFDSSLLQSPPDDVYFDTDETQPTCSRYLKPLLPDSPPLQSLPDDAYFDTDEKNSLTSNLTDSYLEEEQKRIDEHVLEVEVVKDTPAFTGNRIVDINYFLQTTLRLQTRHNKKCTGGQLQLYAEKRDGLKSVFIVKCNVCETQISVSNEDPQATTNSNKSMLNRAAVWGTLSTGSTYTHTAELLSVLDIPNLSEKKFYGIQRELSEVWQNSLWANMKEAGREEREAAIKNRDVDNDGIPFITVYLDGGWSKRSYGHTYNAASGVAVIIGKVTGKLLFIGVRNKYCSICARAESSNELPGKHICFKNWDKPSSSMEQDIIVEGFMQSINMHGLRYKKFIADGDSSVYAKIKEKVPYGLQVIKVECMNHAVKNYGKALYKIKKDTKCVSLAARKMLSSNIIDELVKSVQHAIYNNSGDVENLKRGIRSSVNHVFGDHSICNENLCAQVGDRSNDKTEELRSTGLHHHIYGAINMLLTKAHLLKDKETNNRAELFMSLLCRFNMGKRLNLIQRDSFQIRSNLTGLKYNQGHLWHSAPWKTLFKKSPGKNLKKFMEKQERKVTCKRAHPSTKKSIVRKIKFPVEKQDYGSDIAEVEISDDQLKIEVENICTRLQVTETEQQTIFKTTVGQFNNQRFICERMHRLTASNFGAVIRRKRKTSCDALVKKILNNRSFSTPATEYGKANEGVALSIFIDQSGMEVQPCGLMVDLENGFLGASPDGMISEKEIVEIKCCHKIAISQKTLEEAVLNKQVAYLTTEQGQIKLKKTHDYYYQVQGQLAITKADKCYFIVYTGARNKLHIEIIERDDNLWQNTMLPKLKEFFVECLAPEIILNRRGKGLKCRDPAYIVEAQQDKLKK